MSVLAPNGAYISSIERIEGDFRHPRWTLIENVDSFVGSRVLTWPPGRYSAAVSDYGRDSGQGAVARRSHKLTLPWLAATLIAEMPVQADRQASASDRCP